MKKKISLIVFIVTILSFFSLILFSCNKVEKFKQESIKGDSKEIKTVNNGGFVLERGKYIYFVDGNTKLADLKKGDNNFGKAKRGALYRIEKDDLKNNDFSKVKKITPAIVYDTDKKYGVTTIDDWFYYATPYTDKEVDKKYVKFVRTKLDGSLTEVIAVYQTVNSNKIAQHKFTKKGLYVVEGRKLILHKYTDSKILTGKNSKTIVTENLSKAILPILDLESKSAFVNGVIYLESYNKDEKTDKKKKNENNEEKVSNNSIFYFDGEKTHKLIEGNDKTTFSLVDYSINDSKVTLFFNKAVLNKSNETGFFALKEKETSKIKCISENEMKNEDIYPISYEDGIITIESNSLFQLNNKEKKALTASMAKKPKIISLNEKGLFYISDSKIKMIKLEDKEPAKILSSDEISDALLPELVNGYIYFFDKEDNIKYINLDEAFNSDEPLKGRNLQINKKIKQEKDDKNKKNNK